MPADAFRQSACVLLLADGDVCGVRALTTATCCRTLAHLTWFNCFRLDNLRVTAIPEPAALALSVAALLLLAGVTGLARCLGLES